jgi:PleD family two-component response regulator
MTQPLALIVYEKLLPGSQLVNRLQDLQYRVQGLTDSSLLVQRAEELKPMVVLADLGANQDKIKEVLKQLRRNQATEHLPVIAFCSDEAANSAQASNFEGATLLVGETAVLNHLPQLLEKALQVE